MCLMRIWWLTKIAVTVGFFCLLAGGASAARVAGPHDQPAATSFTTAGELYGVAATSASNAWAVGVTRPSEKTLILHWNGTDWTRVTSPKPVTGVLDAVSAVSANNVWAVGDGGDIVMHWNGKTWSRPAGVPKVAGILYAVTASANNVWAVGATEGTNYNGEAALILHWTGGRWYVLPTPEPTVSYLTGVGMTGPNNAWVVGYGFRSCCTPDPLLLRWNGAVWKAVSFPLQGANRTLFSIAAAPSGAALAVGADRNDHMPLSMWWNGRTWRKVSVPVPAGNMLAFLNGVSYIPGGTAWAVGGMGENTLSTRTLIERWTGTAWTRVTSPSPGGSGGDQLTSVAATSLRNAWAVGTHLSGSTMQTVILHWNGRTWS
jgi:hypothetical protein